MTNLREAAQMALEALEYDTRPETEYGINVAIEALRAALAQPDCACDSPAWCKQYGRCHRAVVGVEPAQPEQEPVAWYHAENYKTHFTTKPSQDMIKNGYWQPLYAAPPQREWQGLTDFDLEAMPPEDIRFARAIEAKLKEKNS